MPYRDFQINEILTAANVNTYLMDQTIMTFADATARDAALTSPSEGMFAYLSGTNLLTFYDGAAWQEFTSGGGGVTVSATAPASPDDGDLWWNSTEGELYVYYNDGTSSQWVAAAGPSVTVAATAPTGYEGQLWLDSTDGSMYVYYTDPGGANAQWIGAVSNNNTAGNVIQVVSTTKTDVFSTTSTSFIDVTGVTLSVTPASTSSKVFVSFSLNLGIVNGAGVGVRLMRDSTPIAIGDTGLTNQKQSTTQTYGDHQTNTHNVSMEFLDSPSTTSTTVYKLQVYTSSGTMYVNRSYGDEAQAYQARTASTITAMEVAG